MKTVGVLVTEVLNAGLFFRNLTNLTQNVVSTVVVALQEFARSFGVL